MNKEQPQQPTPAPAEATPQSTGSGAPARSAYPVQRTAAHNETGLPDGLKTKMEGTFGTSLDHLRVNKNSSFPAKVGAIATAQGNRIDIAPGHYNPDTSAGQKLIGHEAWHTVQQSQGRVKPTMQMKSGHAVNDDRGLESEADAMGDRVASAQPKQFAAPQRSAAFAAGSGVTQRIVNLEAGGEADEWLTDVDLITALQWLQARQEFRGPLSRPAELIPKLGDMLRASKVYQYGIDEAATLIEDLKAENSNATVHAPSANQLEKQLSG